MSFMKRHHKTRAQIQRTLAAALHLVSLNLPDDISIPSIDYTYRGIKVLKLHALVTAADSTHDDDSTTHAGLKAFYISIAGSLQPLTMDDARIPAISHLNMANHQVPSIKYTLSSNLDVKD
ncbi:hypothetical protein K492DRAFT_199797 [Lichtheimia hyalospora FSU 10163]|nr:hypothetical protein K492DRAFT_199797 [Lichtheimia hyalospora FSU 10163]